LIMPKFNYQNFLQKIQTSEDAIELLSLQKEIYACYNAANEQLKKTIARQMESLIMEIIQKLRKINQS
jgi:hypothetical protein